MLLNLIAVAGHAQFLQASIGVNGLTCSQCSRSVEMQLRKLSFVKDVRMDLEHTEGTLHFVSNRKVDIDALAKAVKDAGFSIRYLKVNIDRSNIRDAGQQCFLLGNDVYLTDHVLPASGILTLTFTGKKFGSARKVSGAAAASCKGAGQVYHVQLL